MISCVRSISLIPRSDRDLAEERSGGVKNIVIETCRGDPGSKSTQYFSRCGEPVRATHDSSITAAAIPMSLTLED